VSARGAALKRVSRARLARAREGQSAGSAEPSRQYRNKWPRAKSAATSGRESAVAPRRVVRAPQAADPTLPKHVRECFHNGGRRWALYVWKKFHPTTAYRLPFLSKSWRCSECARFEAAVTFARIRQAFAQLDPSGVVFVVLTLDRDGYFSGKPWADVATAHRGLSRMSRALLKRLNRLCKARGWTPIGSRWVAVVEAHRSGWPHVNFMLYCRELAAELERERLARLADGATARASVLLGDELLRHARETGWGPQSTAERARSRDAVIGYITKLVGQAAKTTGELAKITQAPLSAPEGFRRLRAGKGFLPARHKNPGWTGTVVRRVADPRHAAFAAEPMARHNDATIPMLCAEIEERRIAGGYPHASAPHVS
jgi:hypothetical protein